MTRTRRRTDELRIGPPLTSDAVRFVLLGSDELIALEAEGVRVVPTARAARLTMDREGIRRLAAEELGLPTSPYRFCTTQDEVEAAVAELGVPCVMKPVMSSSGKGQSVIRTA